MRRRTTRPGTLLAALGVLAGSALLGAGPAQAADLAPGFYKPAFTDTITRVAEVNGVLTHHAVSFEEWQQAGFPAPKPSPTEYVKYSWAPYIAAVTYWPDGLQWDSLDGPMWQRAGSPTARNAGYIAGTEVVKYATSSELIAFSPDHLTSHKLTPREWSVMGNLLTQDYREQDWFVRTWNPAVVLCPSVDELCTGVSYEQWTAAGQPTPQPVFTTLQDRFTRTKGNPDIYVDGPGLDHVRITYAQWRAAEFPVPDVL